MASFHMSIGSNKKGTAEGHAKYICRMGRNGRGGRGEDLVATAHGNLPPFCCGDPFRFWAYADQFVQSNGAACREVEIALPRELNAEQRRNLVEKIVDTDLSGKPFHFAIHCPAASIEGGPNPHVHILYADHVPDGIDRPPEQYFGRHNPKDPARGGCPKASGGLSPLELKQKVTARRALVAALQNQALEAAGSNSRVDHRSNKERGKGETAERHLGAARIRELGLEDRNQIAASRKPAD